ncbi:hypothetical protein ACFX2A_025766 [Malus domestica]
MAMIAAASITHDRGFHMKPKNLSTLFSCSKIYHKSFPFKTNISDRSILEYTRKVPSFLRACLARRSESFSALLRLTSPLLCNSIVRTLPELECAPAMQGKAKLMTDIPQQLNYLV